MHKARAAVGSSPSAPLNHTKGSFRQTPPYLHREGNLCAGGSCKSSPQAESRVHYSCARSVRSATRCQLSVPQLAFRAYPDDRLEDRGGARPRFVERVHLRGPIITIPITLYGYGNGDDAEEGVPRDGAMGREHGENERDKVRRCSRSTRPLGDRKRDMLQLHPATESRSPRAPDPRPACAGD